jgi:hypothetical protein
MRIMNERFFPQILMICLLFYVFSAKGYIEVSDTFFSIRTAQAIVTRGQLDIPYAEGATLQGPDGRSYSKYGLGLALYYVPWVAAGDALARHTRLPGPELEGFLISFANIPFAMLALVLFAKLLKLFGVTGTYLWLLPLGLGLGTLTWRYACSDLSEEMQMGLLMLAVYGVARGTPKAIVGAGGGFASLILVKLLYIAYFPLFLAYLILQPGRLRQRIRNAILFTIPFVLVTCLVAWLNMARFGNPLESGYGSEAHRFIPSQVWHTVPLLIGSLDKGLLIFCPILILGVFGWKKFITRYRPEALLCGGLVVENLILIGAWYGWDGGWSWGPRFLIPVIPFWLLPAAFWIPKRQSRATLGIVALLTLISFLVQIPGVLVKDQEIHQIKENMLTAQERRSAPSDYVMAYMLLRHKLAERNEVYRLSEFHISGDSVDRELDLTQYRTFIGLNIWTEEAARQLKKPALRWFPLLALFPVGFLTMRVRVTMETAV